MPQLSRLSAANDGSVFGLDSDGDLYACQMGRSWTPITAPAKTTFISMSAAADGTVWAVSNQNELWAMISGQFQQQECSVSIAQVAVGNSQFIWGIDKFGNVYSFTPRSAGQFEG